MKKPEVSVVTGVYNGARELQRTIDSVLSQRDVDLEYIVVDDGSTDETLRVLETASARDTRVRILRQEKQGLTRALILGCGAARGEFVARQDVGDVSRPTRLRDQLLAIRRDPNVGLVSCWVQYLGPEGEPLYRVTPDPDGATERLRRLEADLVVGPPHHGTALFPRPLYEEVGGYRAEFYFAQDLDLWTRFVDRKTHTVVPEILYEATIALNSLTLRHRKQQVATTRVILECTRQRRAGLNEAEALLAAVAIRPKHRAPTSALTRARGLYFIGSCLRKQGDRRARKYFREALSTCPVHFRSLVSWVLS
jgi:glycosyltransferase involved in cell wall biosynthesis